MNISQIQTLFASAKTQLATVTSDVTTLQNDLQSMETLIAEITAAGGASAALWLRTQLEQLTAGFQPYINAANGGPTILHVVAPDPNVARDTKQLHDARPVTATVPYLA